MMYLYTRLIDNAITVIKNQNKVLPIRNQGQSKIAYVKLGDANHKPFLKRLKSYANVTEVKAGHLNDLILKLKQYDLVIVGLHKSNANPWKSYKIKDKELVWLYEIARTNKVILNVFTRPYALLDLKTTANFESVVVGYQNSVIGQQRVADALFGTIKVDGKLPVSSNNDFPVNSGETIQPLNRLGYDYPENQGFDLVKLKKIDSVVNYALQEKMTTRSAVVNRSQWEDCV